MFGQVPSGYVDPSALGSQYPVSSKPSLPDSFVAPSVRNPSNASIAAGAGAGGGLLLLGLVAAGAYALTRPSATSPRRGDRWRR